MRRAALAGLVVVVLMVGGCKSILGANQVGGTEPGTWVYIKSSKERGWSGVYRCTDARGAPTPGDDGKPRDMRDDGVVCVRAKMMR